MSGADTSHLLNSYAKSQTAGKSTKHTKGLFQVKNVDPTGLTLIHMYQKDRNDKRGFSLGSTILSYKEHLKLQISAGPSATTSHSPTPTIAVLNREIQPTSHGLYY